MKLGKMLTAGLLSAVLMFGGAGLLPDTVSNPVIADAATSSYTNEVFGDVGKASNQGVRTQNTGYNIRCKASKYGDTRYQSIPLIDTSSDRLGLDYTNYQYNSYCYSVEALKKLKANGVSYLLIYLGQTSYDSNPKFTLQYDKANKAYKDFSNVCKATIDNAKKAGVKIGLIYQGNPKSKSVAQSEAEWIYSKIKNWNFELPLFYAAEYTYKSADLTNNIIEFYKTLKAKGYNKTVGLYTNGNATDEKSKYVGTIDAYKVRSSVSNIHDLCIYVPAYDNYGHTTPVYDDILYIHQYSGNNGFVSARGEAYVNGIGYTPDLDMAFTARPANVSAFTANGNTLSWSAVSGANGYKLSLTYKDGHSETVETKNLTYTVSSNVTKAVVKALRTDKYGFTAESYSGKSTPSNWRVISLSSCTVTLAGSSYYWSGKAIKPAVTVKNGSKVLTNGKDYTVSYANNTAVGTATVTVKGTGSYSGTVKKTFTIKTPIVKTVTIPYSSYTWSGKTIKPAVTVKDSYGNILTATDYDVRYAKNINIGEAVITVTGKGKYTGTVKKTFVIKPKNVNGLTLSKEGSGISVKWTKSDFANVSGVGCEIMWSKDKTALESSKNGTVSKGVSIYELAPTCTSFSTNVSGNLVSNTTYYVYFRTFYKDSKGNKYGNWTCKSIKL